MERISPYRSKETERKKREREERQAKGIAENERLKRQLEESGFNGGNSGDTVPYAGEGCPTFGPREAGVDVPYA